MGVGVGMGRMAYAAGGWSPSGVRWGAEFSGPRSSKKDLKIKSTRAQPPAAPERARFCLLLGRSQKKIDARASKGGLGRYLVRIKRQSQSDIEKTGDY